MKNGELIKLTLETLKKRLNKNSELACQNANGSFSTGKCVFNQPIQYEEIIRFQTKLKYELPIDYINFLMINNGCTLFEDSNFGGEILFYRLEEIESNTYEDNAEGFLKIGTIYQENIIINLKLYKKGEPNYLMVKDQHDHFLEAIKLESNFEIWFDRFIICQGEKFWNWKYLTAENYYKE
jgi:hypothetical protein